MKKENCIPELLQRIIKSVRQKKYNAGAFQDRKNNSWHKITIQLEGLENEESEPN